ncbi:MAG: hypothetical protein WDZ49_06785 [Litorilinea sp.]
MKLSAILLLAFLLLFGFGRAAWAGGPVPVVPTRATTTPVATTPATTIPVTTTSPVTTTVATPVTATVTSTTSIIAQPPVITEQGEIPPTTGQPLEVEVRFPTNLRAGPNSAFRVVKVAAAGDRFTVLACNPGCNWYMVEPDVWIAAFLVIPLESESGTAETVPGRETDGEAADRAEDSATLIEPTESDATESHATDVDEIETVAVIPVPEIPHGQVTVRVDTQIYRGPGTNYRRAYFMPQGEQVTVVGRNSTGAWYVMVSGDWIAAAAVTGAPADLPTAWEPPPPPGGPEQIISRPAAPPENNEEPTQNSSVDSNTASAQSTDSGLPTNCVNINTASFEELKLILHIDEDRAGQILGLRPFSSVDDMERINGIASVRLAEIKNEGVACAG